MDYDMEVRFTDGSKLFGDAHDATMLAQLGEMLAAKARGEDDELIGVEGGRLKRVGDIASIRIEARF